MMTDTQNKFFSRDRQKAFDEIKEMMYDRMAVLERMLEVPTEGDGWDVGFDNATENEISFIRSVIDMMERS